MNCIFLIPSFSFEIAENVQQTLADGKEKPSKSLDTLNSRCKEAINFA